MQRDAAHAVIIQVGVNFEDEWGGPFPSHGQCFVDFRYRSIRKRYVDNAAAGGRDASF